MSIPTNPEWTLVPEFFWTGLGRVENVQVLALGRTSLEMVIYLATQPPEVVGIGVKLSTRYSSYRIEEKCYIVIPPPSIQSA